MDSFLVSTANIEMVYQLRVSSASALIQQSPNGYAHFQLQISCSIMAKKIGTLLTPKKNREAK